jgi:PAS domain S-box-containing protein
VYLKEVPENFVRITSGLGEALPRNILIVPLKLEEQVFGLIEIASFKMIEDFEIEFVEKLGESIASTISTVRNSERTNKLLQETQLQAEQMRAQEEEVRQNMEELSATQEEMQRILNEVQAQEAFVKGLIDASNDLIISIDREYKIISANKASIDSFKSSGIEVAPGLDMFKLISDEQREMFKGFYDRAQGGEDFEVTENYSFGNKVQHVVLSFSPLRNEKAEVIGVVEFTKDISALVEATNEAERLLKASQEDAEELKAQEEELRQNLEEMNTLQEEMSSQVKEIESLKNDLEIREGVFGLTTILSEADLTGNITLANKKLCEVSKYSNEELVGMPHSLLRHPDMPKELFKLFWQTIKRGEVFKGIIKNRAKDGTHYWVDATIVPVKDENGQITKYVGARYHLTNDEMAKEMYNAQAKKLGHPLLP